MSYVGFFYVEAKSFEIRSEFSVGDAIRLAERSKGLFRAMFLNKLSLGWFRRNWGRAGRYKTFAWLSGWVLWCISCNGEEMLMEDF